MSERKVYLSELGALFVGFILALLTLAASVSQ